MIKNRFILNYFLCLFSLIPISILVGSSFSLINIILIDLSFIFLILYLRDFSFLRNKNLKYLIFLGIYLLINSFLAKDFNESVLRNFGFIRLIIFFLAFNYFFNNKSFYKKVLLFWMLTICVVIIDVIIERNLGKNIFGFESINNRVVSFFKDEAIVGGYLNAFLLLIVGFLMNEYKNKNKLIMIFSIIILYAILMTGERANSIKAFLGLVIFFIFFHEFKFFTRIFGIFFCSAIVIISLLSSDYLKFRFIKQIEAYNSKNNIYFKLYKSGYDIFKDNKLFGVGNKNFRIIACKKNYDQINEKEVTIEHYCTTHPHQTLIEIISEHGIVGSLILMYIFFKLFFSKMRIIFLNRNYIQQGCLIYLLLVFMPIIPTGSFFSDYVITLFFINLSLLFATDPNLNIFNYQLKRNDFKI